MGARERLNGPEKNIMARRKVRNDTVYFTFLWAIFFRRREGGVRVCGDAVLRYIWCGFAVISILTRGIAVSKH